jgi:2-polyprenyl-3-methyl-5-hydroxy-6-metoxy-1,4-benzoquinol methylase
MRNDKEIIQGLSCPLCQHTGPQVLYRMDAKTTAEHMFHFAGSEDEIHKLTEIIEKLWGGDYAKMLRCENCQLVFADPFVAGSGAFYSAVYKKASYYPDWKWDYEITYRDLHRDDLYINDMQDAHLLEVGAGNGAFVKRLTSGMFSKKNMLCTEYSEYGSKQITDLGIRCLSGPLETLTTKENQERFDYICMFQVLEHMDNLNHQFTALNHLSHKGSIMYITVPSDAYRAFYDRLGRHMDTPPNHISRWNLTSLKKLGEAFGWRVMDHHIQSMPYREKLKRLIFDRLEFHAVFNGSKWVGRKLTLIRKAGLAVATIGIILVYPGAVIRLRNKGLGISQWVKFVRE